MTLDFLDAHTLWITLAFAPSVLLAYGALFGFPVWGALRFAAALSADDTGMGSPRCGYCHSGIDAELRVLCRGCLAPHHSDCWSDNSCCATCQETRSLSSRDADPAGLLSIDEALHRRTRVRRLAAAGTVISFFALFTATQATELPAWSELADTLGPLFAGAWIISFVAWILLDHSINKRMTKLRNAQEEQRSNSADRDAHIGDEKQPPGQEKHAPNGRTEPEAVAQ